MRGKLQFKAEQDPVMAQGRFHRRKMMQLSTQGFGVSIAYNLIFQLEGEDEKIPNRRPHPQKSYALKRGSRSQLEGPYKIVGILTSSAYQLAHLNGNRVLRSWNIDHLKMY